MATGAGAGAGPLASAREHVALEHLAALAGARDPGDVDLIVGGNLRRGRSRRHAAARLGGSRGRRRRGGGLGSLGGLRRGSCGRGAGAARSDLTKQRAGRNRLAVLRGDLRQNARCGRVDFESHLVGFQLHERLVGLHGVAGLLEPLCDRGFGNGFSKRGNSDLGHVRIPAPRRPLCLWNWDVTLTRRMLRRGTPSVVRGVWT